MKSIHKHLFITGILVLTSQSAVAQFGANINLADLNGGNGFAINGLNAFDRTGLSVSYAGDVNGDGIDDVIVGAPRADPNGNASGSSYVIFGSSGGFPSSFELSTLNGSNGFSIHGAAIEDESGAAVSHAGDVNGDGIGDVIIGARLADPNGISGAGISYVVFGRSDGFVASLELSNLDGSNGFAINGVSASDLSGSSLSHAGDVNGDGIDDVIIGSPNADSNGTMSAGNSHVVFGSDGGFQPTVELSSLDGNNGFTINGEQDDDRSGSSVGHAGDLNGDGIDDVIIGARLADPNNNSSAGISYVVFGNSSGFPSNFDLSTLNGSNGFSINGVNEGDNSGFQVSFAGDVNGDGIDDVIISAFLADPNGSSSGRSYVLFGNAGGFPSNFELSSLNGSNGFSINGVDAFDESGWSVSKAGDVNGDGIDDVIIGAPRASINDGLSGGSYVVFGSNEGFSSNLELSSLDGDNGFSIAGAEAGDESGWSVSHAGDFNGDGIDDLIIGAADRFDENSGGSSYIVFGRIDSVFKNGFESSGER